MTPVKRSFDPGIATHKLRTDRPKNECVRAGLGGGEKRDVARAWRVGW